MNAVGGLVLTGADAAKADGDAQTAWLQETEERILAAAGGSRLWTVTTPSRRQGKTTLLRNLARRYKERGFVVFALTTCSRSFSAAFAEVGAFNVRSNDYKEQFGEALAAGKQVVFLVDNAKYVDTDSMMMLRQAVKPFDAIFVQACDGVVPECLTVETTVAAMPEFMKTYGEYCPELETATLEEKRAFVAAQTP